MILKLGMQHQGLKLYKVYINDDPELTLTYFTTMSNLAKLVFVIISQISGERLQDHWSSGFFFLFLLGMSSGVRISERSNHVPKSEPNFSIRRFE